MSLVERIVEIKISYDESELIPVWKSFSEDIIVHGLVGENTNFNLKLAVNRARFDSYTGSSIPQYESIVEVRGGGCRRAVSQRQSKNGVHPGGRKGTARIQSNGKMAFSPSAGGPVG